MKHNYFSMLLALALPAAAQQAALTPVEDTPGEFTVTMPAEPAWRPFVNGQSVVRMTLQVPGAAACRLRFAYLGLAKDEAMYLHAAGETAHGPYLGHGPVNRPDFESMWLPGDSFAVTATAQPTADFPFLLHSLHCLSQEELKATPIRFSRSFTPSIGASSTDEVLATIDNELVRAYRHNNATVFQGDIVLPDDAPAAGKNPGRDSFQVVGASRAWPRFRIPYVISLPLDLPTEDGSVNTNSLRYQIASAIYYWNSLFPGLLVPAALGEKDYVDFVQASGVCQTSVGRVGGGQHVELDPSCGEVAVRHEIGHAIGLWHEMMRQDRDTYVKINWDNIKTGKSGNFVMLDVSLGRQYGAYDYGSLMHYSAYGFSKNGKPTIEALKPMPTGVTMGMATAASATDVASVRNLVCSVWYVAPKVDAQDAEGGPVGIDIVLPSFCPWTASENVSWMSLNKTSGTGSFSLEANLTINYGGGSRSANITINGKTVRISQNPLGI